MYDDEGSSHGGVTMEAGRDEWVAVAVTVAVVLALLEARGTKRSGGVAGWGDGDWVSDAVEVMRDAGESAWAEAGVDAEYE